MTHACISSLLLLILSAVQPDIHFKLQAHGTGYDGSFLQSEDPYCMSRLHDSLA